MTPDLVLSAAEPAAGFAGFGLRAELLQALAASGYRQPSPVQAQTIPLLLQRRDLIAQAQTGTGKTAAFALPCLHNLDAGQRCCQVLVLTPTRELALQVAKSFDRYGAQLPQARILPIYGGSDFRPQIQGLKRGAQVVVGTPGRIMDHMRQGTLSLDGLHVLVLDEADEMLRMGFIDDVTWIMERTPPERQLMLFSATMPPEVRHLSGRFLRDPAEVTVATSKADTQRIRQQLLMVHANRKLQALVQVLDMEAREATMVFVRTKQATVEVATALDGHGYRCAALNGDVVQSQREQVIERLRSGRVDVVVATDVAARGIDVERITMVINYDVPLDAEAYVHRIGRTGRAGRQGRALLLATPRERRLVQAIERFNRQQIEVMEFADADTVNQRRRQRFKERVLEALDGADVPVFEELVQELSAEHDLPVRNIAAALAQLVQGAKPFACSAEEPVPCLNPRRQSRPVAAHMERYRIEVGWKHRVKP
ncbi:ATP-dependent RNA helicase, partial [Candidatus Synechococcus spongiarum LMB bulk15M]